MAMTQIPLRLDEATGGRLKMRAFIERRSMNKIVAQAVQEYLAAHPVAQKDMRAFARAIAKEDASLLKALADA